MRRSTAHTSRRTATRSTNLVPTPKTAIGFANCADTRPGIDVVGVTSAAHHAFVHGLGCYDEAITYDDIAAVPSSDPVVSIDMSGNGLVLERVHSHFGGRLRHSMAIGRSHHDAPPRAEGLPGPRPTFFFAPTQVKKRIKDWGAAGYQERIGAALRQFVGESRDWLAVARSNGPEAAAATWRAVHAGGASPERGFVVSMW